MLALFGVRIGDGQPWLCLGPGRRLMVCSRAWLVLLAQALSELGLRAWYQAAEKILYVSCRALTRSFKTHGPVAATADQCDVERNWRCRDYSQPLFPAGAELRAIVRAFTGLAIRQDSRSSLEAVL